MGMLFDGFVFYEVNKYARLDFDYVEPKNFKIELKALGLDNHTKRLYVSIFILY